MIDEIKAACTYQGYNIGGGVLWRSNDRAKTPGNYIIGYHVRENRTYYHGFNGVLEYDVRGDAEGLAIYEIFSPVTGTVTGYRKGPEAARKACGDGTALDYELAPSGWYHIRTDGTAHRMRTEAAANMARAAQGGTVVRMVR